MASTMISKKRKVRACWLAWRPELPAYPSGQVSQSLGPPPGCICDSSVNATPCRISNHTAPAWQHITEPAFARGPPAEAGLHTHHTACVQFVADGVFYAELNELLTRELAEDGYSGVEVRVTPLKTEIIVRATRTQKVLGKQLCQVQACKRPPALSTYPCMQARRAGASAS